METRSEVVRLKVFLAVTYDKIRAPLTLDFKIPDSVKAMVKVIF